MYRYWKLLYELEIAAALSVLLSLALPWHVDHGTGLEVLQYAFSREAEMLVVQTARVRLRFSGWMLLTGLPLIASFFGMRAILAVMTGGTKANHFIRLLMVMMLALVGWFWQANLEQMANGFWLCAISVGLLSLAVTMEFSLPVEKRKRKSLRELLFNQPPGEICPNCGAWNGPLATRCRYCKRILEQKKPPP